MRKSFLVGDYLPGYASVYKFASTPKPTTSAYTADELKERFEQRSIRFQKEQRKYGFGVQIGLALALLLVTGFFNLPMRSDEEIQITFTQQELVQVEEVTPTKQDTKPPPPPRPPVPIEVPNDEVLEDIDLDLDASLDIDEVITDLPPPPPPPKKEVEAEEEPEIFVIVEEMPELLGGIRQLASDLYYPDLARKAGLEGTVVVQIVVNPDGTPSDPQVVKSVAEVLDNAAVEAVMKQRFKPGKQRGRAVAVRMAMPVKFRLKSPNTK
ncbi:MAG: energy transducer TonB [Rhodothermales bacterium]|nr:energy transducer TonB [Rhodothermales bacterium]